MDKETLSNYGWIVICVLVLAVMIALAGPFGTFVAGAVKSTTAGLFGVNQNALGAAGIEIGDQAFDEGGNGGQGGAGDQGGTGNQGGTGLPAIGTSAEDCTWDEIKAISEAGKSDEYFNLGDTKTFTTTDGKTIVMEIVAFNADTKADGTGTAGITWISKNIIETRAINSTNTALGGWMETELRAWLQGDFYSTLPADVKNTIATVNKTYHDYVNGKSTKTCSDTLWIPSVREVTNRTDYEIAGPSYSYFTDNASRIKYNETGTADYWLLRSSHYGSNQPTFALVTYVGSCPASFWPSKPTGVVIGFCI